MQRVAWIVWQPLAPESLDQLIGGPHSTGAGGEYGEKCALATHHRHRPIGRRHLDWSEHPDPQRHEITPPG
jgi:hypothetical protein